MRYEWRPLLCAALSGGTDCLPRLINECVLCETLDLLGTRLRSLFSKSVSQRAEASGHIDMIDIM